MRAIAHVWVQDEEGQWIDPSPIEDPSDRPAQLLVESGNLLDAESRAEAMKPDTDKCMGCVVDWGTLSLDTIASMKALDPFTHESSAALVLRSRHFEVKMSDLMRMVER